MRGTELLVTVLFGAVYAIYTYYSRQRRLTYDNHTTDSGTSSPSSSWTPPHTQQKGRRVSVSKCVICLQVLRSNSDDSRKLRCGHIFHRSCLVKWLQQKRECPLCRKPASQ